MIRTVDKGHTSLFDDMVPAGILAQTGAPGVYSLGVFDENFNMRPIGFATFIASCPDSYKGEPLFFVNWFYITEDERCDGHGTELLDTVRDIARKSGASGIVIKCTEGETELKTFLEKRGFTFEGGKRSTLSRSLKECSGVSVLTGTPDAGARSFHDIAEKERELFDTVPDSDIAELVEEYLAGSSFGLDDKTGCCYISGGNICAALVSAYYVPGELEIVKFKGFHGFKPGMAVELLQFFRASAEKRYPPDTLIKVVAEKESSRLLLKKLFPDAPEENIYVGTCGKII